MKRREFITLVGGGAAVWPLAARAQQAERMRRLAALLQLTKDNVEAQRWVAALRDGLQKLGWVEGRNLRIDYRWGGTDMNTLKGLAKEIVAAKPDVIFTGSSSTTQMLKQQTSTIPIIFGNIVDPVGQGFVAGARTEWRTDLDARWLRKRQLQGNRGARGAVQGASRLCQSRHRARRRIARLQQ